MGEKDSDRSFAHHLENPLWLAVLRPDRILSDVEINGGDWAEIGSGSGVFTFPLARLAQEVHALDANARMVDLLGERVRNGDVGNVKASVSGEYELPLGDASVDGVFAAFVAHEFSRPDESLREIARVLRPGGRAVIVDFAPSSRVGPRDQELLSAAQVDALAAAAGLAKGRTWNWPRRLLGVKVADILGLEYRSGPA